MGHNSTEFNSAECRGAILMEFIGLWHELSLVGATTLSKMDCHVLTGGRINSCSAECHSTLCHGTSMRINNIRNI